MPVESVEAVLLTAHMAVYVMIVMVTVLLSTILTVSSKKRKYTQRKPKLEDPTAPLCPGCPYGYRRIKKSGTTYKPTCRKCKADKKSGRTRRRSSSASEEEEDGVAESSETPLSSKAQPLARLRAPFAGLAVTSSHPDRIMPDRIMPGVRHGDIRGTAGVSAR